MSVVILDGGVSVSTSGSFGTSLVISEVGGKGSFGVLRDLMAERT